LYRQEGRFIKQVNVAILREVTGSEPEMVQTQQCTSLHRFSFLQDPHFRNGILLDMKM